MSGRTCQYAEDLSATTGSSNQTKNKAHLQFTGTVGATYYVIAHASLGAIGDSGGDTLDVEYFLNDLVAGMPLFDQFLHPNTITDYYNYPLLLKTILPSGSPNFDMQLGIYVPTTIPISNPTPVATIRDSAIIAIPAHALDATSIADGAAFGSGGAFGTSYAVVDTCNLTVPIADDYFIVAFCQTDKLVTTTDYNVKIDVDGVAYGEATMRSVTTVLLRGIPYFRVERVALTAGDHTITIQAKGTTTGGNIYTPSILAMPAKSFPRNYFASTASGSHNTTTMTTKNSTSGLVQAKPHIILGSALVSRGGSKHMGHQTVDNGSVLVSGNNQSSTAGKHQVMACLSRQSYAAVATHLWEQQINIVEAGVPNALIDSMTLLAIQESDDVTTRLLGGKYYGGKWY